MMPHSSESVQPILPPGASVGDAGADKEAVGTASTDRLAVGSIYLVGAGPGDPRLITLRGLECLRQADAVLYDGLANSALLDYAPQAERICVGKHGEVPIWKQSAINQRMIDLARQGKRVVRLKGGDPAVFARTAEELEALTAAGVRFEVVPGITAALAVASYAGIPLTHRDHASAVAFVTGQQQELAPQMMDWEALASFPGTLVIYMGVTTVSHWAPRLLAAGKPPETPVAIVRRCSWSDQQIIRCRLDEAADRLTPSSKLRPPVLVIVGEVARLGSRWNWLERQPLHGCGIWIPRASHQQESLRCALQDLGAQVVVDPVLRIQPPSDTAQLKQAIRLLRAGSVHGVTFSSSNGVDGLLEYLFSVGGDARWLAGVCLAAVGPATAGQLLRYGLTADVQPIEEFSAAGLVACLASRVRGQRWIVTQTQRSTETLAEGLERAGAEVVSCHAYDAVPVERTSEQLAAALAAGAVQFVVITSSYVGQLAHRQLGRAAAQVQPIAMGSGVAESLRRLGWPAVQVAPTNTAESLVECVVQGFKEQRGRQAAEGA